MQRFLSRSARRVRVVAAWLAVVVLIGAAARGARAQGAKNVIIMIADGAGFNAYDAASMFEGRWDQARRNSTQVYDGPGWVKYACTTYPLNMSTRPTGDRMQDAKLIYRPELAWDATPLTDKETCAYLFAGYQFLMQAATDSAAAATAIASGQKTFNAAINWSNTNRAIRGRTLAEIAKKKGKAVGVVTTVPWSHATPACLGGAHSIFREEYQDIANEMLRAPYLDVIMGAGHPEFDDNGRPATKPAGYVGGARTWALLKNGKHPKGWRLIQTKAQFKALADGTGFVGLKVLGVAQVHTTLQQQRGGAQSGNLPFAVPLNGNVPDLRTMVQGALSVLESDPDGFYLAVEGGAVDWASHQRQPARMVEEQSDFNRAVEAVVRWVETRSHWNETLLVVTADHETGMVWGENSDKIAFEPLEFRGREKLPGLRHEDLHPKEKAEHTNSLVPLYVRGVGSPSFAQRVRGTDKTAQRRWHVQPGYVDNTDIFAVARECLEAERVPGTSRAR
jgi:alkaline phosphatase